MACIAFASAKGSPGVTTALAALAATWSPERELLVVDADPAGGDLVVRFDLATEPGLVTLAAAGRRELSPDTLVGHTQALPALDGETAARRDVLVAPVSAEQASAALSALRGALPRTLDALGVDVLVDCGRLDPPSPAYDLAMAADLLVMVCRPVVSEVHHLAARVASLNHPALSLLLVGDHPYSVTEVADTVGANPLGMLPIDPRAAAVLNEGRPNAARVLRRSRLLRDARALSEGLADWLGPVAAPASGALAPPAGAPAGSPSNGWSDGPPGAASGSPSNGWSDGPPAAPSGSPSGGWSDGAPAAPAGSSATGWAQGPAAASSDGWPDAPPAAPSPASPFPDPARAEAPPSPASPFPEPARVEAPPSPASPPDTPAADAPAMPAVPVGPAGRPAPATAAPSPAYPASPVVSYGPAEPSEPVALPTPPTDDERAEPAGAGRERFRASPWRRGTERSAPRHFRRDPEDPHR